MTGAPRKLTARRVWRAVLKQPRFRLVQKHVPSLSLSAVRVVLLEVCAAIAESEDLGVYRLEAGGESFARALEMRLGVYDGGDAIAADLAALIRRGLVLEVEGGLSVPVDWDAVRGVQAAAVEAGKEVPPSIRQRVEAGRKGGRPPDPNSERQRRLRLLGDVSGARSGSDPGYEQNRAHNRAGSEFQNRAGSDPGSDGAYSPIEVLTSTPTESTESMESDSVVVEAGTSSFEAESRAGEAESGAGADAPVMRPVMRGTGDITEGGVSASIAQALTDLASDPVEVAGRSPELFAGPDGSQRLAAWAVQLSELDPRRNRNVGTLMAGWLAKGHTPALILQHAKEVRAENKRRLTAGLEPIDHLSWCDGRLRKAAAGGHGPAVVQGGASSAAPPPSIPRELERPWINDMGRLLLGAALRAMDGADRPAAERALARLLRADERFREVIAAARPGWAAEAAA